MLVYLLTLCAILATKCEAARILAVFPTPSVSHQVVFRPLTQELAKRGHEVVVITADPAFPKGRAPANLTEIDVHEISYKRWQEGLKLSQVSDRDGIGQRELGMALLNAVFEQQLETSEVKEIVRGKQNFDLIFVEDYARQGLAFSHVYKAPVILISSFGAMPGTYEKFGVPAHPILYPSPFRHKLYNLTLWEIVSEVYTHYQILKKMKSNEEKEHAMLKRHFGEHLTSIAELQNNIDMLFVNIHPIFEGNFPVPPSVVHISGIHHKPQNELPQDLKSYLESSKHGVIYVSFGTNADPENLPPGKIQMFTKVLSQLPYDVLWKWNTEELPGKSPNIRISKWFPQSDLLRHPKIKLFITQGGLQSTDEAITAGVPMVGIPMLGDQFYNTEKYVFLNIGVKINVETVTEDEFRNAINTVIQDESFRKNIKKFGNLMRDQSQPPLERAVWWTEYVLRHSGARHLRSPAANITWSEYLLLEFLFTLLLGLFVIVSLWIVVLYQLYRFFINYFSYDKLKRK